jgi:hypothetical protein
MAENCVKNFLRNNAPNQPGFAPIPFQASASKTRMLTSLRMLRLKTARSGIGAGHLFEVAVADEMLGEFAAKPFEQIRSRAGKVVADEAEVILLGQIVLAVDGRVAGQGQPNSRADAGAAKRLGAVTLGGEGQVAGAGLGQAAVEIQVRVDGPEGALVKINAKHLGQVWAGALLQGNFGRPLCHWALQNQPLMGASKPATFLLV